MRAEVHINTGPTTTDTAATLSISGHHVKARGSSGVNRDGCAPEAPSLGNECFLELEEERSVQLVSTFPLSPRPPMQGKHGVPGQQRGTDCRAQRVGSLFVLPSNCQVLTYLVGQFKHFANSSDLHDVTAPVRIWRWRSCVVDWRTCLTPQLRELNLQNKVEADPQQPHGRASVSDRRLGAFWEASSSPHSPLGVGRSWRAPMRHPITGRRAARAQLSSDCPGVHFCLMYTM